MNHPYLHQNNSHRYSPFSPPPRCPPPPPPPPPPSHSFPENPTFYEHHHHHHYHAPPPHKLPPPPMHPSQPQPQQQLPSYRPFSPQQLPPQRPYDLRHFINNPLPDDRVHHHPRSKPAAPSSSSHHQFYDLPNSPRLAHRVILHHRVSQLEREVRPDLWDHLTRVVPENRPRQHHHVEDFDQHRQFDGRTVSPDRTIDRFRQDLEGDFRFREELNNRGFGHNLREDFARDMIGENYNCHSDISSWDLGLSTTVYESNSSHYDNSYGSASGEEVIRSNARDGSSDNLRWVDDRDIRDSVIEMENGEIDDGEVARILSRKVDYHITTAERYNDRGSREGSHELSRTPRKQIQKKSAFLRIQMAKPNHRNREDDRLHYSGYFEDIKSNSFRGKDSMAEDKEREGSPMELDVSFKSNSLVAKAIVAPSSSNVSGTSLTPRSSKIRKITISNKDGKSSQPAKLNEGFRKLDISSHVSNKASGSNKDSKQAKGEDVASGTDTKTNDSTRPSTGTRGLLGKTKVEEYPKDSDLDKDGTDADPSKLKVVKKKKILKKVVKRVTNPPSRLSCSESTGKVEESLKEDSSGHGLLAESIVENIATPLQEEAPACTSCVPTGDSQPYSNEATLLPENGREDGFRKERVLKNVGTEVKTSSSTVSNNDRGCNEPLNETTVTDLSNVAIASKPICQKGGSLLQNGTPMESLDVSFSVGGRISSELLSSKENNIHENLVNTSNLFNGMDTTISLDHRLFNSQESNIVSETGIMDSACKQVSDNQVDLSVKSGIGEGSPQVISLQGCSLLKPSSNSVETITNIYGSVHAKSYNNSRDASAGLDSSLIDAKEVKHVLGSTTCGQAYCDAVITSPKDGVAKGPPDAMTSIQGNEEDKPNICNKGKVLTYQEDLSDSVTTGMCFGSIEVDSSRPLDTALSLCHKNFSPAGCTDSEKGLHVSLQSCADGVSALHGISIVDGISGNEVSICSLANVGSSVTSLETEEGVKGRGTFEGLCSRTTSLTNERLLVADFCKSIVELASNSKYCLQEEVMLSNEITSSGFLPSSEGTTVMLETNTAGGSSWIVDSVKDAFLNDGKKVYLPRVDSQTADALRDEFLDDGKKLYLPRVNSCSVSGNLPIPSELSLCESGLHSEQKSNATLTKAGNSCQTKIIDMESSEGGRMDIDAPEEQVMICGETSWCQIPSEHQSPDLHTKSSVFNYLPIFADGREASRPIGRPAEFAPDIPSYMDGQASLEKACEGNKYLNGKSGCDGGSTLLISTSCSQYTGTSEDHSVREDHPLTSKGELPTTDPKDTTQNLHLVNGETHERKNHLNSALGKSYPSCSSAAFTATKTVTSSTRITKPRTWHRTGSASASVHSGNKTLSSTVPLHGQLPKKVSESSSTYIRKGNSLLRKASPSAAPATSHVFSPSVYRLNSMGVDEVKGVKGDGKTDSLAPPNVLKAGFNAPFERPRTPPLPNITKIPNRATGSLRDLVSSPSTDTLATGCCETVPDPVKSAETDVSNSYDKGLTVSEIPLSQASSVNNGCWNEPNDVNLAPSHVKRVTYVKRKSNQLIATSNVQTADKTQTFLSDGYYKRRKNQLIRTSADNHVKQTISSPDSPAIIEGQTIPRLISYRSFGMRRSHKAVVKPIKRSKFSLVWTLHGADISKCYGNSLQRQKVLPHLFPWKRATYWRTFTPNSAFVSRNNSLSTISQKLLLLRKRDTVYTRSTHGFSLRKSKVLSVGGSNLKWSKSIERDSKKANEEATLAIVAVEKKKRERHGTGSAVSGTKKRSHSSRKSLSTKLPLGRESGERIFRIGSVRYKMDSSKRTLQRIPDESSSCSAGFLSEDEAKKPYVPRRLVIGNDEYVRIGNGNQLIRDPKKRARALASEKIRWSLHTARLRLAKKRKYCQFFTRFGECNKDDGKCPYIHDPSKIAVCTKFLNGLCSNSNCKLTHKVIPERMPDCSYFLQGLCTNKNCPYRHVHVNPNAPACEGFLKGYCADGNECQKKHSYACPVFEATGSCPQGSKCKLHHPKNRSKGQKRKRSCAQKNARGRYFGSLHAEITEPGSVVLERHSMQEEDAIFGGKLTDYIGLDVSDGEVSDEEAGESNDLVNEKTTFGETDLSDLQLDDLDELIKPVRIMTPSDPPHKSLKHA